MQLNGNNLSGSIDANIGEAKSLSILYLQDNSFSGPIPAEIGQTSLVKFQASNQLNGTLTPLLGNLSGLTELMLGANSFSGTIPTSLGNCTELVQLDLSRNHLEGAIPDQLIDLMKLSTLDVSENNLTGSIPRGFFSMLSLQMLNVAFNNLSGVIPNQGNGPMFVIVNFTGNPYLCVEGSCGTNMNTVVNSSSVGDSREAWPIVVGVFASLALGLFVVSVLVYRTCRSDSRKLLHANEDEDLWTLTSFTEKIYHDNEVTALVAPEYSFSTRLNEKIDIYSFGVVLLELVSGKRAIDPTIFGEYGTNLVQWVHDKVQTLEGIYEILDGNCETDSREDMIALLQIGTMCTSFVPANRPSMQDVVMLLINIAPKTCMNSDANKHVGAEEGCHSHDVSLQT